jgi:hypothetical protein
VLVAGAELMGRLSAPHKTSGPEDGGYGLKGNLQALQQLSRTGLVRCEQTRGLAGEFKVQITHRPTDACRRRRRDREGDFQHCFRLLLDFVADLGVAKNTAPCCSGFSNSKPNSTPSSAVPRQSRLAN